MTATRLWVLTALPLALVACGDPGADQSAAPATGDPMLTDTTTSPMAAGAATAQAIRMEPVGGSGVTGEMEVMAHGEQTMVNVTLNGPAGAASTHSGHIHQGTCDNPGSVVVPLQDVTLANGTGRASSMVDVAPAAAMDGQHIVAYHTGSGDNPGAPAVCAPIPREGAAAAM
jgi:hypothetical protein